MKNLEMKSCNVWSTRWLIKNVNSMYSESPLLISPQESKDMCITGTKLEKCNRAEEK